MPYAYETERSALFTEEGQRKFLEVRDQVKQLLASAGAFRFTAIHVTGDSFVTLACIDRLVELKEIVPLRDPNKCWSQYQVYSTPDTHNY